MEPTTMKLLSTPDSLNVVEGLIEEIKMKYNVCEDSYGNMLVAITEAVNNAIFHGNKGNPEKEVSISYNQENDKVMVSIGDEGPGFDYYNIPDPTAPENIDKPNGRGIFLMKQLADQLIFSNNGKTVELYFNIS